MDQSKIIDTLETYHAAASLPTRHAPTWQHAASRPTKQAPAWWHAELREDPATAPAQQPAS